MEWVSKILGACALAASWAPAEPYSSYKGSVPGGYAVSPGNRWGHANGWRYSSGFAATRKWTKEICLNDADKDGHSNGVELGDPCCTWSKGKTPFRTSTVTHPGIKGDASVENSNFNKNNCIPKECENDIEIIKASPNAASCPSATTKAKKTTTFASTKTTTSITTSTTKTTATKTSKTTTTATTSTVTMTSKSTSITSTVRTGTSTTISTTSATQTSTSITSTSRTGTSTTISTTSATQTSTSITSTSRTGTSTTISTTSATTTTRTTKTTATNASTSRKTGDGASFIMIDVRTQREWDAGHISCAKGPLEIQKNRAGWRAQIDAWTGGDKDYAIYTYCATGVRAGQAAKTLKVAGYTNVANGGGYRTDKETLQTMCSTKTTTVTVKTTTKAKTTTTVTSQTSTTVTSETSTTGTTETATSTTKTTDLCAGKECGNGTCNAGKCECAAGWDGADCKNNINECAGVDCGNGSCKDGLNGFSCDCAAGWGGDSCKVAGGCTAGANGQPCQHSGSATGITGQCRCKCINGHTAKNCEIVPTTATATTVTTTTITTTTTTTSATSTITPDATTSTLTLTANAIATAIETTATAAATEIESYITRIPVETNLSASAMVDRALAELKQLKATGAASTAADMLLSGFRVDALIYAGYTESELAVAGVAPDEYAAALASAFLFREQKVSDGVGGSGNTTAAHNSSGTNIATIVVPVVLCCLFALVTANIYFSRKRANVDGDARLTKHGAETQYENPAYEFDQSRNTGAAAEDDGEVGVADMNAVYINDDGDFDC